MAKSDKLSRRNFLANAGKMAAGAAAGAVGLSMAAESAAAADAPQWPWPYKKLDPEAVYWKGNSGYYDGG